MLSQIISMLSLVISSCVGWFNSIMSKAGVSSIWVVSVFMIFVTYKLLIPFLGHSGSDRAKQKKEVSE